MGRKIEVTSEELKFLAIYYEHKSKVREARHKFKFGKIKKISYEISKRLFLNIVNRGIRKGFLYRSGAVPPRLERSVPNSVKLLIRF